VSITIWAREIRGIKISHSKGIFSSLYINLLEKTKIKRTTNAMLKFIRNTFESADES